MFKYSGIAILWTMLVTVLCGLPGDSLPDLSIWKLLQFDSFAHALVFGVFSFLWSVAFCKQRVNLNVFIYARHISLTSGIVFGVIIEYMQFFVFVRRSAEWTDMVADAIGCVAGILIFNAVYGRVLREIRFQN